MQGTQQNPWSTANIAVKVSNNNAYIRQQKDLKIVSNWLLQLKDIGKTRTNQNPKHSRKSKLKNTEKLGMEAEAGGLLCFPGQPYLCRVTRQPEIHIETFFINKTKTHRNQEKQSGVLEGKQNCQNILGVFAGSSWAHSEMEEDITHNRSRGSLGMTAAAAMLQTENLSRYVYRS